jgi:mono/diheme cytochrome c family protein
MNERPPSERPPSTRLLCAAFACCLVLTSAVLIEAPALAHTAGILNSTSLSTADGRQIYERVCQGCHMRDAAGAAGAGHYPALSKNPALASRRFMALTILMGRRNMPAFGAGHAIGFGGPPAVLSEAQIAGVINYVRSHFGNHYKDQITAAEVKTLDQSAKF